MLTQERPGSMQAAKGLWLSLVVPKGCHTFHRVVSRYSGDSQVSAGESDVSVVDWDIGVFWNGGATPEVPLDFQVKTASS